MAALHRRSGQAARARIARLAGMLLPGALLLAVPAFYLVLAGAVPAQRAAGHGLYGLMALLLGGVLLVRQGAAGRRTIYLLDLFLVVGALASAWPVSSGAMPEWGLRLAFSILVFLRLASLALPYVLLNRLLQLVLLAALVLAVSGAGFYWLEPRVQSYGDGLWLAFITGATVGYGDLVPSTAGARVLAGFIVVTGYALFSVLTARIAALLVGEDERRQRSELHADLRALRREIEGLRAQLPAPAATE